MTHEELLEENRRLRAALEEAKSGASDWMRRRIDAAIAPNSGAPAPVRDESTAPDVARAVELLDGLRTKVDCSALSHRDAALLDRELSAIQHVLKGSP